MALEELQNGRYRRIRLLGSGGMGEVYLMEDTRINRQVAIKVTRSEDNTYLDNDTATNAARLFQREARAIAALDHPNILPLYDFGEETLEETTMTYMVMPFCAEGSLASWLRQRGNPPRFSLQDIAHLIEQAADALQIAHDHHVIHLDVKPSNFLLRGNTRNPNRPTLLLADFGIARSSATVANSSRTIRGTPSSMAPEQWSSMPVPATDQYALAVMAYELLAGRPPFVGSMEQLMYQHFSIQPPPPSTFNTHLSTAIDSVILRALAKKPEERFPSIADFANAFEQAVRLSPADLVVEPQKSTNGDFTSDLRTTLALSPAEADAGISRLITLPGGRHVNVTVPAGVFDGQLIRVQGLDESSSPVGELTVAIAIKEPEEDGPSSDALNAESAESGKQTPRILHSSVQQLADPVSEHDLPTLASSNASLQAPEKQPESTLPKRRSAPRSRLVGIISGLIIVLLLLLLLAGTVYVYGNHQARVNALAQSQTATASVKPVQTPTHAPTVAITPTPKPQNGLYIAGTYNGSMFDQITQQTTTFTLFIGQTRGNAVLSGTYISRSPSQGNYPLKGTVDTQGNFSFTVQQPAGQTPLYFYGQFQQDYLRGNYCSSSTNSCSTSTGYFQAGPRY
jgi:serine/threonine protein kinase